MKRDDMKLCAETMRSLATALDAYARRGHEQTDENLNRALLELARGVLRELVTDATVREDVHDMGRELAAAAAFALGSEHGAATAELEAIQAASADSVLQRYREVTQRLLLSDMGELVHATLVHEMRFAREARKALNENDRRFS